MQLNKLDKTKSTDFSDFSFARSHLAKLINWWMTPKLPDVHIFIKSEDRPKGLINIFKVYFRKWLVHPIKRRIARYYLKFLQRFFGLMVIGITGSCGKTTTKEMLASILRQKGETVYSYANIDPVYNIPTTILKCRPGTKYLILEMGVEYPGEMDYYLWLAKPDIGVITNIYPTHTEFFGDVGGVFREKSKLVKSLSKNDFAILNQENNFLRQLGGKIVAKTIWFGDSGEVFSSLEKINLNLTTNFRLIFDKSSTNQSEVTIPVVGKQFIENALSAAAVAKCLGFSLREIKSGLEAFKNQDHRMKVIKHKSGAVIIDDSYNNNPIAAIQAVANFGLLAGKKRKVIVFGDMLELGNLSAKYHRELGNDIGKIFPDKLICVGEDAKLTAQEAGKLIGKIRVSYFSNWREALVEVKRYLTKGTYILIKGSRSIGLDKLVEKL